jgi:hypothetical protein
MLYDLYSYYNNAETMCVCVLAPLLQELVFCLLFVCFKISRFLTTQQVPFDLDTRSPDLNVRIRLWPGLFTFK